MKREEVIAAIEKLEGKAISAGRRDEFVRVVSQAFQLEQQRRESLNADFQRAVLYLFLFLHRSPVKKHHDEFLRPTRRTMIMAMGMVVILVLEVLYIPRFFVYFKISYGGVALVGILIAEFFGAIWLVTKIQPQLGLSNLGMSMQCTQCDYDLSGHESVLGDELWVGPAVCPECGQRYPAVGK